MKLKLLNCKEDFIGLPDLGVSLEDLEEVLKSLKRMVSALDGEDADFAYSEGICHNSRMYCCSNKSIDTGWVVCQYAQHWELSSGEYTYPVEGSMEYRYPSESNIKWDKKTKNGKKRRYLLLFLIDQLQYGLNNLESN